MDTYRSNATKLTQKNPMTATKACHGTSNYEPKKLNYAK